MTEQHASTAEIPALAQSEPASPRGIEADDLIPGQGLDAQKMPGHWLLARLGKRVLRPGGRELTHRMLEALAIGPKDEIVEFAPGLGATARLTLARNPASYTAVERDPTAAERIGRYLGRSKCNVQVGTAEATGLPDGSATVVYGEAMLTMQLAAAKTKIAQEAYRLLKPGGRYAIHELSLTPEDLAENKQQEIAQAISKSIHVGARPLTHSEWRALLEDAGFEIQAELAAPMHLLEPRRLVQDEGLGGALRFVGRVLRDAPARGRVLAMRSVFRKYQANLGAIALIATKP